MYTFLIVFQVLLAIGLVVMVLLQQGKGADAGAAFGSGASSTVFGAQGSASFLSRTTAILAALFFLNSLMLSSKWVVGDFRQPASIAEQVPVKQEQAPTEIPANGKPAAEKKAPAPSDLPDVGAPADAQKPAPQSAPAQPTQPKDLPQ